MKFLSILGVFLCIALIGDACAQDIAYIGIYTDADRTSCETWSLETAAEQSQYIMCKPGSSGIKRVDFGIAVYGAGYAANIDLAPHVGVCGGYPWNAGWGKAAYDISAIMCANFTPEYVEENLPDRDGWFFLCIVRTVPDPSYNTIPAVLAITHNTQTGLTAYGGDDGTIEYPLQAYTHFALFQPCLGVIATEESSWGAIKSMYR